MREDLKKKMINGYEVGKMLANLHKISKELNKPFDAPEVILEYSKRFGGWDGDTLGTYVINPIYSPPEISNYKYVIERLIYPDKTF